MKRPHFEIRAAIHTEVLDASGFASEDRGSPELQRIVGKRHAIAEDGPSCATSVVKDLCRQPI